VVSDLIFIEGEDSRPGTSGSNKKDFLELIPEEESNIFRPLSVIDAPSEPDRELGEEVKVRLMQPSEPARPSKAEDDSVSRKILESRKPVTVPDNMNDLFARRSYSNAFHKAEEHDFEEFKYCSFNNFPHRPIVQPAKAAVVLPPIEEEKGREAERKNIIKEHQHKIESMQNEAENSTVENYTALFNDTATKDAVLLAEIEVEELNDESLKLQALKAEKERMEQALYEKNREEIKRLQEDSKDELYHRGELMKKNVYRLEQESIEKTKEKSGQIGSAFRRTGTTLKNYLNDAKLEVETKYRDLGIAYKDERHNLTGDKPQEKGESEWRSQKQMVEVRVELLRCVKDKLPKGRYAILCSTIDRIGGSAIDVSSDQAKKFKRLTAPKTHSGEYHLNSLRFEKSLVLETPSRLEIRPSMVYLFELFLLKSKEYTHDQVLGWGVFPLINAEFELNTGRYKVYLIYIRLDSTLVRSCESHHGQVLRHRKVL